MKVSVDISPEYTVPYAVIYTNQFTDEIQRIMDTFNAKETPVTALRDEDMVILQPKDIYMVRIEDGETILYGAKRTYRSRKRLYEIGQQLGNQFMQISNGIQCWLDRKYRQYFADHCNCTDSTFYGFYHLVVFSDVLQKRSTKNE